MKKSRTTLIVTLVISVGLAIAFGVRIAQAQKRDEVAKAVLDQETVVPVRTTAAVKKDLPQVVQITGSVKALNEVMVLPKMPGRVTRVEVEVGQTVKAGGVLAAVEAGDAALRSKQAEAQVQAANAGLAQAKLQEATAQRGFARAQALKDKGAMSQSDFEQAESGVALTRVGVQAASAQVALAESNLALAYKAIGDTRITAPFAGVITKKLVTLGGMASPMSPAFALQDQSSLKLEGTVPASFVSRVEPGMKVQVTIDELPGKVFEASVTRIAPSLDQETRRGAIEIALAKPEGVLPNMFARAEIAFGSTANVVVVPATAVQSIGGEPAVYLYRDDRAVLVRPRLGIKHMDDIVVDEGVAAGDMIIVSGPAGLKDGVRVTVSSGT
ncbi:MAG: efflux RND transporter periplasmic adaptor subunit [Deltaproteobacteria bacterium]|nr:efflux RND transporter periplasmic adaptor subunit [Deltaproteobacteria bacterium]